MSAWTVADSAVHSETIGAFPTDVSVAYSGILDGDLAIVAAAGSRGIPPTPPGYREIHGDLGYGLGVLWLRLLDGSETDVTATFADGGWCALGHIVLRGASLAEVVAYDLFGGAPGPVTSPVQIVDDGGAVSLLVRGAVTVDPPIPPDFGWALAWSDWGDDNGRLTVVGLAYKTQPWS